MGFGVLSSIFLLSLFIRPFVSLQPNTDAFFVSDFFQKMGANASVCSLEEGAVCDTKQHHIVRLVASGLGLSGAIPDTTIAKLRMLQTLDLSNNSITTLSSDFWGLGYSLKTLNLSHNQITGTLSTNIGNFGLLQTLDLSFNNLSGSIPASISSLFNLKHLKLAGNGFAGNIPPGILNCQNLVSLDLSLNKLNGTLPYGFGAALPKLKTLNLSGNKIHGRSSDFSGLNSITYLNISMNLFGGSVMGVFLVALEVMDLSRNRFQGHISQVHYLNSSFNWSRLLFLDMSENQISGEIFHDLNDAQNLKHLNLAHNRFSTQPFPQVDRLSNLEYLNMSNTNLIGKIPIEISQLSSLSTLDLSKNHLTGGIPDFDRQNIQVLDLSLNNLTGHIPFSLLEKITLMKKFNFSYNNFTFCTSKFSPKTFQTAFIWSMNNCPIAVNPHFLPIRKTTKDKQLKLALVISLSLACFVVGLVCLALGCRRETRMWAGKQISYKEETTISGPFSFQTDSTSWVADVKLATSVPVVIFEKPLLNFTFADLLCATSNFDRGSLLAEGRYGPVYRGFLSGGIHVAVKVFVNGFTMSNEEASREVDYLGRIKHPNLVPLTGYCMVGDRKIIMYDYMNNGNLQNFLHDLPLGVQATEDWSTDTWEEDESSGIQHVGSEGLLMTWRFRHKIALGTARALAFLHHGCSPPITLQYVKASNVYLDSNWEARVSDFGLNRIFGSCVEEEITPGYVAPEFSEPATSSPTPKSDVYGFGVILFELITGKKPIGDDNPEDKESNLVGWVRGLVRRKQSLRAVDPKIQGTAPENCLEAALRIGYLCTAQLPTKRPTMQQVLGLLKDIQPAGDT